MRNKKTGVEYGQEPTPSPYQAALNMSAHWLVCKDCGGRGTTLVKIGDTGFYRCADWKACDKRRLANSLK